MNIIKIIIPCIALCLACCTAKTDSIAKNLKRQNSQFPEMLTNDLRIDSIIFLDKTNTLKYYYTVFNDSIIINCNYDETQKNMATEIKTSQSMKTFRNNKMIFEYIYISNESKNILLRIVIPESMYK
ncbi:MAG: hypothetical protein LBK94_04800 [Prevotellaceae bacterium]|jgi:hypothetical protein|nr:hypothetical protein [Prevotellaceae bacterium]